METELESMEYCPLGAGCSGARRMMRASVRDGRSCHRPERRGCRKPRSSAVARSPPRPLPARSPWLWPRCISRGFVGLVEETSPRRGAEPSPNALQGRRSARNRLIWPLGLLRRPHAHGVGDPEDRDSECLETAANRLEWHAWCATFDVLCP